MKRYDMVKSKVWLPLFGPPARPQLWLNLRDGDGERERERERNLDFRMVFNGPTTINVVNNCDLAMKKSLGSKLGMCQAFDGIFHGMYD